MRISLDWLQDYIELHKQAHEIADILTSLGLEAEGIEQIEQIPGGLQGVFVGEVKRVWPHPNADRLRLTEVLIFQDQALLQIVCGAPNVAEGQKVLVATEGATLYPKNGNPITIKKGKIRGEESQGMICAEDELGLGDSHEGILILDPSAVPGTPASKQLNLASDQVIEIGLTPNRADATNHVGVARDICAWMKVHENPQFQLKTLDLIPEPVITSNTEQFKITVEDTTLCPRYAAAIIKGVKVRPSPDWMQKRLISVGQKPINNIVDITNYVLFELGQPLHAFNLNYLPGGIIVKTGFGAYPFITLDGVERKLNPEDLMICDQQGVPHCIAGVMGGLNSGVDDQTVDIFLESAHFQASSIRKTSTRHLIFSQAAKSFEKGSDPNICMIALRRAIYLLQQFSQFDAVESFYDEYPKPITGLEIEISLDQIVSLSGLQLNESEVKNVLSALDLSYTDLRNGSFKVQLQTNKPDVQRPADLIEEIARVYGLEKIPIPDKFQIAFTEKLKDSFSIRKQISNWLSARNFNECMTVSLTDSNHLLKSGFWDESQLVYINNTSNSAMDVLKPSHVINGLETISFNQNRQLSDLRIYEWGKNYVLHNGKPSETEFLGIWQTGMEDSPHWKKAKTENSDYYSLKSIAESLLNYFGVVIHFNDIKEINQEEKSFFQYGIHFGDLIRLGRIDRKLLEVYDIKSEVWFAEINLKKWISSLNRKAEPYKEISKYPSSARDLAIVVDENISFAKIMEQIFKSKVKNLKQTLLFDIYRNPDQLGPDKKSMAIHFHFESTEASLSSKDLDQEMARLTQNLERNLGALIRK